MPPAAAAGSKGGFLKLTPEQYKGIGKYLKPWGKPPTKFTFWCQIITTVVVIIISIGKAVESLRDPTFLAFAIVGVMFGLVLLAGYLKAVRDQKRQIAEEEARQKAEDEADAAAPSRKPQDDDDDDDDDEPPEAARARAQAEAQARQRAMAEHQASQRVCGKNSSWALRGRQPPLGPPGRPSGLGRSCACAASAARTLAVASAARLQAAPTTRISHLPSRRRASGRWRSARLRWRRRRGIRRRARRRWRRRCRPCARSSTSAYRLRVQEDASPPPGPGAPGPGSEGGAAPIAATFFAPPRPLSAALATPTLAPSCAAYRIAGPGPPHRTSVRPPAAGAFGSAGVGSAASSLTQVRIEGLSGRPELNGRYGKTTR